MPSEIPPSLRRSLLAPLDAGGRAAEVERRIEEAIELGVLGDGERLPSEAELAAELGVAPMTLREALVGLRRGGLVVTRRGRDGGTFVRGSETVQRERLLARLAASSVDQLRDLYDEHAAIAAATARLAAERALDADLARLEMEVAALDRAAGERAARAADSRFHIELAVAARSLRLTRAQMRMEADLAGLVWTLLGASRAPRAAGEHRKILAAVRAGNGTTAARRMRDHVEREAGELAAVRLAAYAGSARPTGRRRAARTRMVAARARVEEAVEPVFALLVGARDRALADPARLDELRRSLTDELTAPGTLMSGIGIAFDREGPVPGPHWTWWRGGAGGPVPLLIEDDPLHPDFYDYESAAWYAVPHASGERSITGPFIDFGAADDHIFTLAVPIPGPEPDAPCVGVVGADVSVANLERVVVPALLDLGGEATLLNGEGVVIASSASATLPGRRWDLERLGGAGEDERVLRSDALGWVLVAKP